MPGKRSLTAQGRPRFSAVLIAMLIRELMDGPCTTKELAAVTGIGERSVLMYVTALYRRKCIRIAAWERDVSGKQSIRVWAFGATTDAAKQPGMRKCAAVKKTEQRRVYAILGGLAA